MGGANIHTRSVWGWRRTRKINGVKKIKKAETHNLGGKTITGSKIDSEKKKKRGDHDIEYTCGGNPINGTCRGAKKSIRKCMRQTVTRTDDKGRLLAWQLGKKNKQRCKILTKETSLHPTPYPIYHNTPPP